MRPAPPVRRRRPSQPAAGADFLHKWSIFVEILDFSVRERTVSPAARIDIEIFGLGSTSKSCNSLWSEVTTSLTYLRRYYLNVGQPLPLAERRRYLFELRTRDGDVGNASNNFPLYVRCTYSNHGRPDGSSGRGCAPIFLGDP